MSRCPIYRLGILACIDHRYRLAWLASRVLAACHCGYLLSIGAERAAIQDQAAGYWLKRFWALYLSRN